MQTDSARPQQGPDPVSESEMAVSSRRDFMSVAGATVIAGAAGVAALTAAPAQAAPGAGVAGITEVVRPKNLGPKGMLDNRYPATFAESVPRAVEVLMGYFAALTARDLGGMAEYLHFPFGSFEGTDPIAVTTPEELLSKAPPSMNMSLKPERRTDHDGYMKPGSYDIFRGLEVLTCDPVVVGIAMSYDRYDERGSLLLRSDGVYSMTNNDGRWAIQLMSTIFTPADMIGVEFPDAVLAAHRLRIDHDLSYQVDDPRHDPLTQEGPRAGIGNTGGAPFWMGPEGRIMDNFKIKGVKSRLRITPASAARVGQVAHDIAAGGSGSVKLGNQGPDAYFAQYRKLFETNGIGKWGFVYGKHKDSRVLHHTANKVHILTGAVRYTTAGEFASSNYDIGVTTYKAGRWGSAGSLCYTTPHDRSNDLLPG